MDKGRWKKLLIFSPNVIPTKMHTSELLHIRLYNQLLADHRLQTPEEIVSWMGAMQSQSLDLAKWAIGTRLNGKNVHDIDEALNTGKIIRTHILRPTWHFVSAEDHRWMFELSKLRLQPIYRSYCKTLGAEETVIYRAVSVMEKALEGGNHLTKEEIGAVLQSQGILLDTHHLTITLSYAEMEGTICNGRLKGNKQTFTLLEEWISPKQPLPKEEAVARLAERYFSSHSPATIHDFAWWSGLSLTECRQAVDMIRSNLICEEINGRSFWMRNDLKTPPAKGDSALLLPPFDEFVVSYKDRSEIVQDHHYSKVMTKNGLFSPTIMLNGEIIGSWKKSTRKGKNHIELSFFEPKHAKTADLFTPEVKRLEQFYDAAE